MHFLAHENWNRPTAAAIDEIAGEVYFASRTAWQQANMRVCDLGIKQIIPKVKRLELEEAKANIG